MTTRTPRRPRFLAGVPETPSATPAQFTSARARGVPAPLPSPAPHLAAPVAATPPPDRGELRRETMERLAVALEMLREQAIRLAEQARGDAVEIGFQVARKVLETEVRQSPEAVFALVRSALRRAGDSRRIAIRVAPEDAELLESEPGRQALDGLTAARVECVADPSLQRGDCVVDADFGQVDGRLGTRLAEIRRAVDAAAEEGAA